MIRLLWSLVWVGAVSLIVSTMLFGQGAGVNKLAWLGTGLVLYALVAIVRAAWRARAGRWPGLELSAREVAAFEHQVWDDAEQAEREARLVATVQRTVWEQRVAEMNTARVAAGAAAWDVDACRAFMRDNRGTVRDIAALDAGMAAQAARAERDAAGGPTP